MRTNLSRLQSLAGRELRRLSAYGPAIPLFATLLVTGMACRVHLYAYTFLDLPYPLSVHLRPPQVWKTVGVEPFVALALSLPAWGLWRLWVVPHETYSGARWRSVVLTCVLIPIIFACGFFYGMQAHLIEALNVPFSFELLVAGGAGFSWQEFAEQLEPIDAAYLLLPVLLFTGLSLVPATSRHMRNRLVVGCVGACLTTAFVGTWRDNRKKEIPPHALAMVTNPLLFTLRQTVHSLTHPAELYFPVKPAWQPGQNERLALLDPVFGKQTPIKPRVPASRAAVKNVVLIVLESTGFRYAFDATRTGGMPMPYLYSLKDKGLFLSHHVSTANSSHNSIFGIFSGLYPWPKTGVLAMTSDLSIPSLFSLVGFEYDTFLTTPGASHSFFPRDYLLNTGLDELKDCENLRPKKRRKSSHGLHELDAVDYFVGRLERAKTPFVAAYYSYSPHFPYPNPGAPFAISPDAEPLERYSNLLAMLDSQIERIVTAAYRKAKPEETLIVITGDHGEAFNQHPQNRGHSQHSFMENISTPMLFVHPTLFAGRPAFDRYTSHVDILPTVLDALQIPHNRELLQGQSLLSSDFVRDYVFTYGNENAVTSISDRGRKLTVSYQLGTAVAYDLALDPKELSPSEVARGDAQLEALIQYQRFQQEALVKYKNRTRALAVVH